MADTFLFYDIETTGLSRAFDQILDFAAIRTDPELREVERFRTAVRLRPDVIPSPAAILVNRIRIEPSSALPSEYEAVLAIHTQLNRPGTTSIGYNSIGFDDEFLRFSFHRNLLPPYTHQFANRCRRMDLLPITIMYWLHRREALDWPEMNGKTSLKLEDLGAANGFFSGQSHDAAADVEASLRLARRLFQASKMWQYLDGCFRVAVDAQRASQLPLAFQSDRGPHVLGIMVGSEFGTRQCFQAPVLSIGNSIPYPKQTLWLRLDLANLRDTRAAAAAETTWVVRKRYGEPGILLPPSDRYMEPIGPERRAQMEANLQWLQSHPREFEAVVMHHRHYRYPFIPDLDPDAGLYQNGFFPRADESLCREFHTLPLGEKIACIGRFSSGDARTLAARLIWRNYPDGLPAGLQAERESHRERICRADPMPDHTGKPRLTARQALDEISALRRSAALDSEQIGLLNDLERYMRDCFACPPV